MKLYPQKCGLVIKRESRISYGARSFHIFVDGEWAADIRNGEIVRLCLDSGVHEILFTVGAGRGSSVMVELDQCDFDVNMICRPRWNGIEAYVTPVDVYAANWQPDRGGTAVALVLLLLVCIVAFLLWLSMYEIRIGFFFIPFLIS